MEMMFNLENLLYWKTIPKFYTCFFFQFTRFNIFFAFASYIFLNFLRCLTKHCQRIAKSILKVTEYFIFDRLWWRCALATMKAYQCTHVHPLMTHRHIQAIDTLIWIIIIIILTSQGLLKESNDLSDRSEQTLEVSDSSDCPSIDDLMFLLGLLKCSPVLFWK